MKTSKLTYVVEIFQDNGLSHSVHCFTLAEARLVASRSFRALIKPIGEIEYKNGVEVL